MRAIDYYYDIPLPNDFSATIQILKTGRAMAEAGRPFRLLTRPSAQSVADLLCSLGIDEHALLGIGSAFPSWPRTPWARGVCMRARPPTGLRADGNRVVMTRGETGFLVAPALRRLKSRPTFVYELHRLAHVSLAERILGRSLAAGEALPPAAERLRQSEARIVADADGLVFLTDELRNAARAAFGDVVPAIVVPSGVDLCPVRSQGIPDVDLICLGKIEPRKGVDIALQVMRHLPHRRLRIIGNGPGTDWARGVARDLGVEARVDFLGRIDHARVPAELARARVGLVPLPMGLDNVSDRFTSPLKLLEMLAAGLPVVASDIPSVRAVCQNEENALLASPQAPRQMAEAAERLLCDPALGRRLGAAGAARAAVFAWSGRAQTIGAFVDGLGIG